MAVVFRFFAQSLTLFLIVPAFCSATTFTISNNCDYTVWPGILSGAGTPPFPTTGFALNAGESRTLPVPPSWSGRLWGRTSCSVDDTTARLVCATGDCGSGAVECLGAGAAPPATLAEFTLSGAGELDFFDVSLVDGYNIPMLIAPSVDVSAGDPGGNCAATGCAVDLNGACPADLKLTADGSGGAPAVACRSACEAFGTEEYCCSGNHGSPATCRPTAYSQFFKSACPRAYSYAYDDSTSTFTCPSAGTASYAITFCPSVPVSLKSSGENPQAAEANSTMVILRGDGDVASSQRSSPAAILGVGSVAAALLLLL